MEDKFSQNHKDRDRLYSTQDPLLGGTGTGALSESTEDTTRGTYSAEELDYFRSKASLYKFAKWAVGIALTLLLGLFALWIQQIDGPVNQLKADSQNQKELIQGNTKSIESLRGKLDKIELDINSLQK